MFTLRSAKFLSCCLLTCCLLFSVHAAAQSQASTGQIAGTVKDPAGAVIAGATVKAVNTGTGFSQTVQTEENGLYRLVLLPAGKYRVTASGQGFANTTAQVDVGVGRTADVNFTLAVGGRTEEVTVAADAIETTRHEAAAFVDSTIVANMPLNGRRFQDLATLTPAALVESQRQQISIVGQRGINASLNIDGSDYGNPFFGGLRGGERSNFAPTIPQEAIQEFQMVRAGYSAEFGRSTGGIMTAITRSGTNEVHGSVGYNIRHQDISKSNEFFKTATTQLRAKGCPTCSVQASPTLQQWSGAIGGPVVKDKLFYFGSYTQQRNRIPRQVFFDRLRETATNPSRGQEAVNFFFSQEAPYQQTNDAIALLGKVDYQFSNNHRLNLRYSHSSNEALNGTTAGTAILPTVNSALTNNGTEKDSTHTGVGQLTSFFGRYANDLRFQYTREERPRIANAQLPTVSTTIGTWGTVSFLGQNIENDYRFQVADSLTLQKGSHTAKFGFEYNKLNAFQLFGFNQNGAFSFQTTDVNKVLDILSTGGTIANRFDGFDCGTGGSAGACVQYRKQIGNLIANLDGHQAAAFLQDSWRVLPNLTINAGVRWEGAWNPVPTANNAMVSRVNGFSFPNGYIEDPSRIPDQKRQIAPRLGFSWDPFKDGKTVIRGFGGIYYAGSPLLIFAGPVNNFREPPGDLSIVLPLAAPARPSGQPATGTCSSNTNASVLGTGVWYCNTVYQQLKLVGVDLNASPLGSLPILTVDQVVSVATALGATVDKYAGAAPILTDIRFKNPRSYQAGFGFEREIANGITAGIEGTWVKTVYLERNRELNIKPPNAVDAAGRPLYGLTRPSSDPLRQTRPISTLDSIQARDSSAQSLYRGITFRTSMHRKRYQLNAYYTLSENLSDDDNERSAGGISYVDHFNFAPEYYFSELDRKHMFVASPVVFLPFDFEVSSAVRLYSGAPITATLGSDANQDRVNNDRPFKAVGVPFKRNQFRNRALSFVDLRVQKGIKLTESKKLKISTEFFNLFNFMNITYSGSTVTNFCSSTSATTCGIPGGAWSANPNFLRLRDATTGALIQSNNPGAPFQVQFSARFEF